jgi:glycine/D-amino acid oxidase-like deaminating enzyme
MTDTPHPTPLLFAGDVQCCNCDYSLSRAAFDAGKGRIMFSDVGDGLFRCGVCDDRADDPQGMIPNDDEDDDANDDAAAKDTDVQCSSCGYSLSRAAFDAGKGRIMFSDVGDGRFCCGVCDDRVDDPEGMFPNDDE